MHSKKGEGHLPDWEKVVYVEREKHWMARKVKEALLINAVNPTKKIEAGGILNLEKGYEVKLIRFGVASMGISERCWRRKLNDFEHV